MAKIVQTAGWLTCAIFVALSLLAQPGVETANERMARIDERLNSVTERVAKLDAVDANIRLSRIEGQLGVIEKLLYGLLAAFGGFEGHRALKARRRKETSDD